VLGQAAGIADPVASAGRTVTVRERRLAADNTGEEEA
jgi:hypothetical protein